MPKVLVIAQREFRAIVATKAFLLAITIMPILMFGGLFLQKALEGRVGPQEKRLVLFDGTGILLERLEKAAAARNQTAIVDPNTGKQVQPRYLLEAGQGTLDEERRFELSERIRRGELDAFAEIPAGILGLPGKGPPVQAAFHAQNAALSEERNWLERTLGELVRTERLKQVGLDPELVRQATAPVVVEGLGLVDRAATGELMKAEPASIQAMLFLPFGMMMLMFMVIFLAAQPMLESVLEEKSQRIAEVLLGSASAFQLMLGKLLGGVAGSLTVVVTYGLGAYAVAWHYGMTHLVPLRIVPWFIIYQVLAVLLFGAVFMAIGAAVNQLKEAQAMLLPVWLVMMFPVFIWLPIVREPTTNFATWLSFVPPATPLVMVLRMAASPSVPLWQPALGILPMLAATLVCVFAASRVFRIGMLAQGKAPRLVELLRWAVRG